MGAGVGNFLNEVFRHTGLKLCFVDSQTFSARALLND